MDIQSIKVTSNVHVVYRLNPIFSRAYIMPRKLSRLHYTRLATNRDRLKNRLMMIISVSMMLTRTPAFPSGLPGNGWGASSGMLCPGGLFPLVDGALLRLLLLVRMLMTIGLLLAVLEL